MRFGWEGALRVLSVALGDEAAAHILTHASERDEGGRRLMVRNRHARPRQVITAAGGTGAHAPRVNDERADPAADGHREPGAGLWRDCKQWGMRGPPPVRRWRRAVTPKTAGTPGRRSSASLPAMARSAPRPLRRSPEGSNQLLAFTICRPSTRFT